MSKKKKQSDEERVFVYSTNPNYAFENLGDLLNKNESSDESQDLRIWLDRKKRKGKAVTLVTGFSGSETDLKELAKLLKSKCGVGGTAKNGEILIQGDHRKKVLEILLKEGHQAKLAGG